MLRIPVTSTVLFLAIVLTLASCVGDDESPATTPTATRAAAEATLTPTTTDSGTCPSEPFTGSIERTVEAETGVGLHVAASRSDAQLSFAYAYDFGPGSTYTVYVGDHEIEQEAVGRDTLVAPEGGLLATIFVISDERLAAGDTLEFRFVPIVDTGGGAEVSGFGADDVVGGMTIIDVTGDRLCFEIESTDPQQAIDGIVSAEIANR